MSFYLQRIPSKNCCSQKEKIAISIKPKAHREMGPNSCYRAAGHTSTWSEKGTKKKKIALRGRKSTGDGLLAQETSSFWFRLGAKDNGRLTLCPRELPLSMVSSYWFA
ncbi:hypothetical protein CDAR_529461 [Caerostris darwini]|uniref:Uncharacterized protein n=1 Tax=Caerostris darwini TaxID=1538125 RepID=A0AAV4SBV8_9ARAC|nr:hypothetical protein CDAR_529461 [Caerostris darwini]